MVFKRNYDKKKQKSLYKARIVAKGFFLREEIEYVETFDPVVLLESLLLRVEKFVSEQWHVHSADFWNAFLNRDIDVDLFISWDDVVCKLKESLHDLRQSLRL